jgi:hypothetical protein
MIDIILNKITKGDKMKMYSMILTIAILIGLPILVDAASIENGDSEVYQIKGRVTGKNWVYVTINPNGTKYFNCRFGCELVLEKTGSSVQLETDGDVVIRKGVLTVK